MINDIISLILAHLPWEEYSDLLLQEYPFAKSQWTKYTSFTTDITVDKIEYYVNGVLHRTDGPAVIIIHNRGNLTEKYYYQGKLHRIDGPATIAIFGTARIETYYHNGNVHRDNGPAYISTYDGKKYYEIYYRHGKKHRDNGPAHIRLFPNELAHETYWEDDIFIR
jgi:hypothetical protein